MQMQVNKNKGKIKPKRNMKNLEKKRILNINVINRVSWKIGWEI